MSVTRIEDAAWAVAQTRGVVPERARQRLIARADAFAAARRGDPSAVDGLIRIATDEAEPPLVRANAVGYLRRFPDPATRDITSRQPLRATMPPSG